MIDISASGHYIGDCRELLKQLPDGCVQTCVTSPPYCGLRDYGVDGQIGLEDSPEAYVAELVAVFAEVRRTLRDDGTLWLNLGDSYASSPSGGDGARSSGLQGSKGSQSEFRKSTRAKHVPRGLKPKDLVGTPWRVAFALQAAGWYLRSDIIWHKPNPMPESVTDRPTKSHEYLFLLSKSERYFYDANAIAEPTAYPDGPGNTPESKHETASRSDPRRRTAANLSKIGPRETRNKRSVWTVATTPYDGAHFATFPPALITPCILAGAPLGGLVLDPFFGSGTVGEVAETHGRRWIGFDINPKYGDLAKERTAQRSLPMGAREP